MASVAELRLSTKGCILHQIRLLQLHHTRSTRVVAVDTANALRRGFLPREVPPSFTTQSFAAVVAKIPNKPDEISLPVRFNIARAGGTRRPTEIPNPFAQEAITQVCADNWTQLQRITALSPISLSRPVKKSHYRSLSAIGNRRGRAAEIVARMPGGRVTLRTDISQFYPSIYTHAVDWAVRGKSNAKRLKNKPYDHPGPALDRLLRNSRDQQTVGISIGPDTSWLIAELLLARVDSKMSSNKGFGDWVKAHSYRYGDDMTVFAKSRDQAEDILGEYEIALSNFELSLNPLKVEIVDGLAPPESPWVSRLRQMRYRADSEPLLAADIVDIFGVALDLSRENPTAGVLSYAIKRCDPFPGSRNTWPVYRDLLLSAVMQEATSLRHVYEILLFARDHSLPVQDDRIGEVLNLICLEHAKFNHGFEVAWSLTILRALGLPLSSDSAKQIVTMEDNCSLLLLIEEVQRTGMADVDLNGLFKRATTTGALSSQDWLLAYQCRANKWCPPAKWDGTQAWKDLSMAGVQFLVPGRPTGGYLKRRRPSFMPSWGTS